MLTQILETREEIFVKDRSYYDGPRTHCPTTEFTQDINK